MLSKKVWVIAIAMINTATARGEKKANKMGDTVRINIEAMLICTPGTRPVKMPKNIPENNAINSSPKIILTPPCFR